MHFSFKEIETQEGQSHWMSLCITGRVQIFRPSALRTQLSTSSSLLGSSLARACHAHSLLLSGRLAILVLSTCCRASWVFCSGSMTWESLCGPDAHCDIVRTDTRGLKSLPLAEPWHLPFVNCLIVSDVSQIASCGSCQAGIFSPIVRMRKQAERSLLSSPK